jgi:hypothetical protein
VTIKSISRARFDRLVAANAFLEPVIGNEMEWFADGGETTVGTVADGLLFDQWTYVVLGRGGTAGFHVLGIGFGVSTQGEATVRLLRTMKASGQN